MHEPWSYIPSLETGQSKYYFTLPKKQLRLPLPPVQILKRGGGRGVALTGLVLGGGGGGGLPVFPTTIQGFPGSTGPNTWLVALCCSSEERGGPPILYIHIYTGYRKSEAVTIPELWVREREREISPLSLFSNCHQLSADPRVGETCPAVLRQNVA